MKLRLFDLHCDTPMKIYQNNYSLDGSQGQLSLDKLEVFESFAQIMAFWADCRIADDTSFFAFHKAADYLNFEVERLDERVAYARNSAEFDRIETKGKLLLSVEDARILTGRLDRLRVLHARGVRFLIPVWGGSSIIGGAHDTYEGLTEFGKSVIDECHRLGIITDISHASEKTAEGMLDSAETAGKSVMASHSNAYSVCPHTRNLRDRQFERVKKLGGIVGISLCALHLSGNETATVDDVIRHIEHYLSLGGENTVALGCDFDGTDFLPDELKCVSDMPCLAERLAQLNYTDSQIDRLFYANAEHFIKENL